MATDAAAPFIWGGDGERLTPDAIKRRRAIAEALAKSGGDYSPIQHPFQGLNRVAQAMLGGFESGVLDRAESTNAKASAANVAAMLGQLTGSPDTPAAGSSPSSLSTPAPSNGGASVAVTPSSGTQPSDPSLIPGAAPILRSDTFARAAMPYAGDNEAVAALKKALGPMESGNRYDITGPVHSRMGTPLGKYQIMSANLPQWSQEALGRTVTPQEFLKSPELQEQIAGHRMGKIIDQYGNLHDAASVWHSGRPLAQARAAGARDVNMSTVDYVNKTVGRMRGPTISVGTAQDDPGVPNSGPGVSLAYRPAVARVAAALPSTQGVPAGAEVQQLIQAGVLPEQITPGYLAEMWQTQPTLRDSVQKWRAGQGGTLPVATNDPDLPASGVGQADVPAAGAKAAGFFIPPAVNGGEPTIVPTPDDVAPGAQPVQQRPAAVRVAQALNPAAIQALSSPYASDAEKSIAGLLLQKQMQENQRGRWTQETLSDGSIVQRNSNTDEIRVIRQGINPLDQESKRLGIQKQQRELNEPKAPTVQRLKQPDGSEIAMQWDEKQKVWTPLPLPPQDPNAPKPSPKLTEGQSKDLVYYNRGVQALNDFEKNPDIYANGTQRLYSNAPMFGNYLTSEEYQKSQQAGRNFLASILRKDTGAAITKAEEEQYGQIFLPQPGDKPGVLAQKTEARKQAIGAIRDGLGTAQVLAKGQEALKPKGPSVEDLLKKYGGG